MMGKFLKNFLRVVKTLNEHALGKHKLISGNCRPFKKQRRSKNNNEMSRAAQ